MNRLKEIQEKELKLRSLEFRDESTVLRSYAEDVYRRVEEFDKKYDLDNVGLEGLSWEEEEAMINEYEKLDKELMDIEAQLFKMEERYNKFRVEINEFYGREVLKDINGGSLENYLDGI